MQFFIVLRSPNQDVLAGTLRLKLELLNRPNANHILRTLGETDWVIGGPHGAAARLAVRRTTLVYKMRRLGIPREGLAS
jgi:transcriptional regulator with GAF, ATPase, and Fis domain